MELVNARIVRVTAINRRYVSQYFPLEDADSLDPEKLRGLALDVDEQVVGAILATVDEETHSARIESFYLEPACRGKGFGRQLLNTLTENLQRENVEYVLAQLAIPEDAHGAAFLIRHGFYYEQPDFSGYYITGEALAEFIRRGEALGNKGRFAFASRRKLETHALEELPKRRLVQLAEGPAKPYMDFSGTGWTMADAHLSISAWVKDQPRAVVIIERKSEKEYSLAWLGRADCGVMFVMPLLTEALKRLSAKMPPDATLYVAAVNEDSRKLMNAALADAGDISGIHESRIVYLVRVMDE